MNNLNCYDDNDDEGDEDDRGNDFVDDDKMKIVMKPILETLSRRDLFMILAKM